RSIYFLVLIWFLFLSLRGPPSCTLFPYTTLFRSGRGSLRAASTLLALAVVYLALYFALPIASGRVYDVDVRALPYAYLMLTAARSEEHTSELQSRENLVCRLLLEKKKTQHVTTSN